MKLNSRPNHPKAVIHHIRRGVQTLQEFPSMIIFEETKMGYERALHKDEHKTKLVFKPAVTSVKGNPIQC